MMKRSSARPALGVLCLILIASGPVQAEKRMRARELGIEVGRLKPGRYNAITDVEGVLVGHATLFSGDSIRTGVTAILPHGGNVFQEKVPAAACFFNAFGKMAGYTQIEELGNIETPVVLTNTLSVGTAVTAVVRYTLEQKGNESVRSVNAVVGETNDGYLNDIRGMHVTGEDVIGAVRSARSGPVEEGAVGAGTGTVAFGYKGGIGTSSRITEEIDGAGYTVGVLVQSNFGWELKINGRRFSRRAEEGEDGSCMIVIATDAPLSPRNLRRLAKRSFTGMGRTRSVMSNGSGDYAIAFSTAWRIPHGGGPDRVEVPPLVGNDSMSLLFRAVEEATEEAIYNSLFTAVTVRGRGGRRVEAIPLGEVRSLMLEEE